MLVVRQLGGDLRVVVDSLFGCNLVIDVVLLHSCGDLCIPSHCTSRGTNIVVIQMGNRQCNRRLATDFLRRASQNNQQTWRERITC